MAVITGNSYFGGTDHNEQLVSVGVKDEGSPLVAIGNSLTHGIEPPDPNHSFGKACVSTCGSRIVVEVHPDPNNLYESYLAFYETETLQPIGLGTTNPGYNSILRYEHRQPGASPHISNREHQLDGTAPAGNTNAAGGDDDDTAQFIINGYYGDTYHDVGYLSSPNATYNGGTFNDYINASGVGQAINQRIIPVDQGPTRSSVSSSTPDASWAAIKNEWFRPHGYVDWRHHYTGGALKWAVMPYETVVHSPVPLRDKIAAIVEYKVPWRTKTNYTTHYHEPENPNLSTWTGHGHGRYNGATSTGHMGVVCLGIFGLDGEVIAIHEIMFQASSKMYKSSDWWKVQDTTHLDDLTDNFPTYESAMVSMGEYGAIKLSAHNGMVAIGCTFNQAHMYDTGTFDIYGPGDGVYLFRLGDSRQSGPKYFTNMKIPAGSYMDFFPEHLDMGSNYIVATGVPRGTGATSTLFDQSTGQRQSTHFQIRSTSDRYQQFEADYAYYANVTSSALNGPVLKDEIGYGERTYYFLSAKTDNTTNSEPYFTGINTSPHASEPYVRLYDMNGLLQAHIGTGDYTDKLSWSSDNGYPIVNYDTRVRYWNGTSSTEYSDINYGGLSSVSLGSGKLVVGISSAHEDGIGMIDVYHLKSLNNILPNMSGVSNESFWGDSKRMVMDNNTSGDKKLNIDSKTVLQSGYGFDGMGKDVFISGQRIVFGSPDGNTLNSNGNALSMKYAESGKVEVTNFDIPQYDEYFAVGSYRFDDIQYTINDNASHQYLFDSKGILAGYATTNSRIEAKDFRSGVLILGTEIGQTPAKLKVLLSPPQDTVLDILGEK